MRRIIFLIATAFTQLLLPNIRLSAQSDKIKETNNGNSCSYFPVVNGMKFTYQRNDMAGEHSIVESYTVVKDKTLKSGKVIKGYKINTTVANRNNTIIYYFCEDGSVKMYSEMPAYNTYIKEYVEDYSVLPSDYNKPDYKKTPVWETEKYGSGKYLSFTELKAGGEGTDWTDRQVVNNNPVTISSEIVETGLSLTVRGKKYSPVIHVERSVTINYLGEDMELNTQDIYYAKGVGKIRVVEKGKDLLTGNRFTTTQELVSHNLPAYKESEDEKKAGNVNNNNAGNARSKLLKGKIDESLVGNWKYFRGDNDLLGFTLIYSFYSNGTYSYYFGSMQPVNLKIKGVWKMNKDTLELLADEEEKSSKQFIQRLNNAYSGKPSIGIPWGGTEIREFESMENKSPWPGIPAFGNKMEPEKKIDEPFEVEIDKDFVGAWRMDYKSPTSLTLYDVYQFNEDGTGEEASVSRKTGNVNRTKFEWRVKDNVLWKRKSCGESDTCFQHNTIEKITIGNKRALKIGPYGSVYVFVGQ